jgi:hypothetical protein
MIAKCSCNHCGGHIEFEADGFQPGTRTECPHCKMETLLFIPPAPELPNQPTSTSKKSSKVGLLVVGIIIFACVAEIFFLKNSRQQTKLDTASSSPKQTTIEPASNSPEQTNLKPVAGAFGWNLGDKFPGHGTTYQFIPQTEMPPFNHFHLSLTEDGRIAQVSGTNSVTLTPLGPAP